MGPKAEKAPLRSDGIPRPSICDDWNSANYHWWNIHGNIYASRSIWGRASLTMIVALSKRNLDWRSLRWVILQTMGTSATVFMILIGAFVFIPFMALTEIPANLVSFLTNLDVGRYGILIIILATYIFLGTFLEGLAMLVLTLHITLPVILELGFDPIWFGVMVVIVLEMGLITHPSA